MLGRLSIVAISATFVFSIGCGSDPAGDGDDDAAGGSSGVGGAGVGGSGSGAQGGDVEPPDQAGMTEAHNVARANVVPAAVPALEPLTWSSALVAIAQAHADKCIFEHSMGDTGENLYAATGFMPTPADVVESWASEDEFYDYETNGCVPNEQCGHYTQVVWRDTQRVGCVVKTCNENSPFGDSNPWINWVCEYDPPGNWVGEKPY